ncbi:TetR/AcrR family transcriptional regulator [Mycobacterium sp. URHB0044]|jgi:TetR/AcrR family transcriptional repressor of lmrAB and yxaGH operons|uniref:TetR/AcrR family transcriptional regulator n=1 Tax=Mycobacterium sp. URHB0044 TaxID=1380386 RepID=UPI000560A6F3|nr:helix-turn-helix domain-containing protein [Mycobacterium sp. URHB0044]
MSSARERLVAATVDLLRRRGVAATGVAEIVELSGAARRSLYTHFPEGKMQLLIEATRRVGAESTGPIGTLTQADDPVAGLSAFETPDLAREAASVFTIWQEAMSDQLRRAGLSAPAAASFASFTVSAIEGAVVQCLAYRSTQPLDVVGEHLDATLRLQLAF